MYKYEKVISELMLHYGKCKIQLFLCLDPHMRMKTGCLSHFLVGNVSLEMKVWH